MNDSTATIAVGLATVSILATWAFVLPTLIGIGLLVQRAFAVRGIATRNLLVAFWVGFAATLGVGQLWHLFEPADGQLWMLLIPLGICGLGLNLGMLRRWATEVPRGWAEAIASVLLAVLAVRVAMAGTQAVEVYDTGLYHLPATLWCHAYPVVPGIANLHGRLGFNSSLFVYAATLNEGLWEGRPHHVVAGPLLFMALVLAAVGAVRTFKSREAFPADLAAATCVAPVVYLIHSRNYSSSISPNVTSFLMVLVSGWLCLEAFAVGNRDSRATHHLALCAVLVASAATTVKLTVAPFAAVVLLLMAWWTFGSEGKSGTRLWPLARLVLVSFLLVGPWAARGVIQSGYPLYPLNVAGLDVDWRVPDEQIRMENLWTRSYSRGCLDRPAEGFDWLDSWSRWVWRHEPLGITVPLALSLLSGALVLFPAARRGWPETLRRQRKAHLVVFPPVLALLVWFFTAPDPRFGSGFCWLLAMVTCAVALSLLWHRFTLAVRAAVVGLVVVLSVVEGAQIPENMRKASAEASRRVRYRQDSGALDLGLSPLPRVEMRKTTTDHGLRLLVPEQGNQVWGAPLLSSPHPSPSLRQRDLEDISEGFVNDGPWRPYCFPNCVNSFRNFVEQELAWRHPHNS
jgi:hypothetical protein